MTKSEKLKGLKVLRPRFYLGELRFILWALRNLELQYTTLLKYKEDLDHQEYVQKHEFLKWTAWRELVKLKAIRKDLAEISRWNLHEMLFATRTLKRRIEGLVEGRKLHSWGFCSRYDKNIIWYQ